MKPVIILTSTVKIDSKKNCIFQRNELERLESYLKAIKQWLYKTNLIIILVENSGYKYDELKKEKELFKDRFEVIIFKENELDEAKYLENNISKGASEMFSINYAFFHSNLIIKEHFIIKITARFFIQELEEYLNTYDLNKYDCLIQNRKRRCEMIGSHYSKFFFIFCINYEDKFVDYVENIYQDRTEAFKNILVCKNFEIEKTQRGSVDEMLEFI